MKKGKERGSCETCTFYIYDEEYEAYLCDMNMDEDGLCADPVGPVLSMPLLPESGRIRGSEKTDVKERRLHCMLCSLFCISGQISCFMRIFSIIIKKTKERNRK